jgi:hypothetical protein
MPRREFAFTLGARFLFVILLLTPIETMAQRSVQSPQCKGGLEGVVSDNDGQPARGINVVAWPLGVDLGIFLPNARTDEAGKYRFGNLCPNRYTVLVDDQKSGYPYMSPGLFEFLYGRRVSEVKLTAKHVLAELTVQLPPRPGSIRIHVTDRTTNDELREFVVRLIVPRQHHRPVIELQFSREIIDREIGVPPDKDFILQIIADGFHKWSDNVDGRELVHVRAGEQITLEAPLEPLR